MPLKIIAGILAVAGMLVYLAPVVLKLMDPALTTVVVIGIVMMLVDLWQSLKSRED
jgi:hypothetical protein